jgi:hypothetical protein
VNNVIKRSLELNKSTKQLLDKKEWLILIAMLLGFFLMGTAAGGGAAFSFAGFGLVIWIFWRGRKL